MDLYVLIGIAIALLVIRVTLFFIQKMFKKKNDEEPLRAPGPVRIQSMGRRAQIPRNQRNRMRRNTAAAEDDVAGDDVDPNGVDEDVSHSKVQLDEKMGTKKRAKLEAKEQKRMMREQELQMREEKKALEAKQDEERKKQDEKEAEEERKRVLAERLAREEQERKEHEEYLKMKEGFTIDGEGYEEDESQKENLLADFIQYIKNNKVVVLEDLATEFQLKTQQAIDRVQELRENGTLTGVIDDRGKFIYVSQDELLAMAKFIKQRGRVSIAELAESSNNLINLTPVATG